MRVLKEGTRLADRYTLMRRLGTGSMSRVWLARDQRAGSEVVLKFLPAERETDALGQEQLKREWRIASRLMHPQIARVFEFHDDPDGPFYAQQYISGPDAGVLAVAPVDEALRPFGLIADALRYAHGKGTVHRDVKSANVLLDPRGVPHLIDFGVATSADSRHTGGGTPVASSPQQRAGEPPRPADDVYALGVLMHETLTGKPPGAMNGNPPGEPDAPLLALNGSPVPDAIAGLVARMLADDPRQRPSAEEVARLLQDAGIPPGPAPSRLLGRYRDEDSILPIEALPTARRPDTSLSAGPPAARASRGVPPVVVWGGVALLMAVFLGVILWLPHTVRKPVEGDTGPTASEKPAETRPDNAATGDQAQPSPRETADRKTETDKILGELLSKLERLRMRGIERWGGQPYSEAMDVYKEGDRAYLDGDYKLAGERYRAVIGKLEPFFGRIDRTFRETLEAARKAFARADPAEAVRLYDLAVAITPGDETARKGLARARNLRTVLTLTEQGLSLEKGLELEAARKALEGALDLDPGWQPAAEALARVKDAILQRSFEQRMTEGLQALAAGDYPSARVSFNAAKKLKPESRQPVDGLLQVDQEVRLAAIRRMEQEAHELEQGEQWQDAAAKYQDILKVDGDLQFAREGLANARERAQIHERLQQFVQAPDSLSAPATMQVATELLLRVSRITPMGPRLEDQKNELSRLLKRAATPLTVRLVSDNATDVSIYQVGHLGTFATQEITLRPGEYVALGSRLGFRDVRLKFRVAPEIDMQPIVIVCEEQI